tara:strand:- start:2014 stop:2703 length:690 start_codon:yes stop_codon:yes gene_type:complete
MKVNNDLVKKTIQFSLVIQILTGIISIHGFFLKIPKEDKILKDILALETLVQFIELIFYIWISFAIININNMTSRRYIDWVITTPTMLLSTIMFMKYQEEKELNKKEDKIKTEKFIKNNKNLIIEMFLYNLGMLVFGYLGEINILPKYISIPIGFIFFYKSFNLIYSNYGNKSIVGKNLFIFLVIIWGLYGVVAILPVTEKNISYNLLDIVAKNFYGLYIYYKISQISV